MYEEAPKPWSSQGGATFRVSLDRVAQHRKLTLTPLASVLVGYSESAQARWVAWLRMQRPPSNPGTDVAGQSEGQDAHMSPACRMASRCRTYLTRKCKDIAGKRQLPSPRH
jgi:hypothetical protein